MTMNFPSHTSPIKWSTPIESHSTEYAIEWKYLSGTRWLRMSRVFATQGDAEFFVEDWIEGKHKATRIVKITITKIERII